MTPELTLLTVNAVFLAFGYFGVYPRLPDKSLGRLVRYDSAICGAALLVAAMLYWQTGVRFSLIAFETNWFWFSLVTVSLMEVPLFAWFMRRYDIDL